jgi:hypothetical protein
MCTRPLPAIAELTNLLELLTIIGPLLSRYVTKFTAFTTFKPLQVSITDKAAQTLGSNFRY